MNEKKLSQMVLNLSDPPWHVTSIGFGKAEGRIDINIDFRSGSIFRCPDCGSACQVHDTIQRDGDTSISSSIVHISMLGSPE